MNLPTPCDICIEEKCGGVKNCNCETCNIKDKCNKHLWPTIRITNKCTQSCSHCCFSCSPSKNKMMTAEYSKNIAKFLDSNNIQLITLMGGEFFCNPEWADIFHNIIPNRKYVRLVSNGDWAKSKVSTNKIIKTLKEFPNLKVSISKDKWHTNKYVDKAESYLKEASIEYNVAQDGEMTDEAIVPIGNGEFHYSMFSMFAQACSKNKYLFMIDEEGEIYKCGYGAWDYANVNEYIEGGFAKKFKEFNQKYYKVWFSNCRSCVRSYEYSGT